MKITYSAQRTGFDHRKAYANPRYFDGVVMPEVTAVEIVGDWPAVEKAYRAAGVPVTYAGADDAPEPVAKIPEAVREVYIPPDWRELPWSKPREVGGLTLRTLVKAIGATAVNRGDALEAIEAHMKAVEA